MPDEPPPLRLLKASPAERETWVGDEPVEPLPLVGDGFMHQLGTTILYGLPNVGKGMVAMHTIRALIEEGHHPVVLDYEANIWEWQQRAYTMGIRFPVITPDSPLTATESIALSEHIAQRHYTHCIVDSASTAKPRTREGDFGAGDSTVAFMVALRNLGVPSLLIGHQGKGKDINGPLGSTHWKSQCRLMWHAIETSQHHLRIICEKYGDGDKTKLGCSFTIVPVGKGVDISKDYIEVKGIGRKPDPDSIPSRILAVMLPGADYTASDIVTLLGIEGRSISEEAVRVMLGRLVKEGKVTRVARGIYSVANIT